MNRSDLEKQARDMGISVDGRWSDARIREEITKKGLDAQSANQAPETRFAEPRGEARFQPVDDEKPVFEKNPDLDKIKQEVKASEKLFPVKLLKNYRPVSPEFQILGEGGEYRVPTDEERMKVEAGNHIAVPVDEAKSVIEKKIAERNDPIR
ncbi:hypothetical protein EVB98_007 [Rhizobium phage RHph_N3_2]|nr:hypothetical protein EVB98_007 [Rhizobium phage RHph_N3_2]